MSLYTWDEFEQEDYYGDLLRFFYSILPQQDNCEDAKAMPIVFVSRKAYCLFLLLKKRGIIDDKGYQVYSDRYVMKCMDKSLFEGKKVLLIDDTISTGFHMSEIIQMIRNRTSVFEILPYVFMKDNTFEKQKKKVQLYRTEDIKIECVLEKDSKDILKFCSVETLLMHQDSIPYMIELPNICEVGKEDYCIEISEEEYAKLVNQENIWKYYHGEQMGYEQNEVNNDVIIREKHIIVERLEDFIFDFCIRVQVYKVDKVYRLVLLPFAILKTVKFRELLEFFYLVYANTEYANNIQCVEQSMDSGFEEYVYTAVYRAVVFFLSMYCATDFTNYLKQILDGNRELGFYEENYKYNYEKDFIRANQVIYNSAYARQTSSMLDFHFSSPRPQMKDELLERVKGFRGITFEPRTVLLFLTAVINIIKNQPDTVNMVDDGETQRAKFLTIESYIDIMKEVYPNRQMSEIKNILTLCFCNMLSQSKISNDIYYDHHNHTVYRGFRFGENSELFFDVSAKVFYAAVEKYYEMVCKAVDKGDEWEERIVKLYKKNYTNFLVRLSEFLDHYRFTGEVISKSEFYIYTKVFCSVDEKSISKCIMNKKFLIENKKTPPYIESLQQYIQEADLVRE